MLPQLATPKYELTIPSTGQTAVFRPFLVREEKILLMAMQSEDERQVTSAVEDIIKSCILTADVDVNKLSMFDIEFIFLKIRSKSIGEIIEMRYQCQNEVDVVVRDEDTGQVKEVRRQCGTTVPMNIDLNAVSVTKDPEHSTQIALAEGVGLMMKYPNLSLARQLQRQGKNTEDITQALDLIAACIQSVYTKEEVITEFNHDEIAEWLETLTQQQFAQIQKFFDTIPRLKHKLHFECPKCGYEQDITIEGIQNFFG